MFSPCVVVLCYCPADLCAAVSLRARQAAAAGRPPAPAKAFSQADRNFCEYSGFAIDLGQTYIDAYMEKMAVFEGAGGYRFAYPAKNFWCITIYDMSTRALDRH
jgi:hypothetical protein